MMKRIFRLTVCFLLICCLLINISPIRAQASGVEAVFLSSVVVNPTIAVTAVLFGLGVMAVATATAAFTKLVDEVTADMVDKGLISSNGVDMYRSDADGAATYLVNQELVEAVREYLWENEVVSGEALPVGFLSYNGFFLPDVSSVWTNKSTYPFGVIFLDTNGRYNLHFRSGDFKLGSGQSSVSDGYGYYGHSTLSGESWATPYTGSSTYSVPLDSLIWSSHDILDTSGNVVFSASVPGASALTVSDGLQIGEIAGRNQTFADGYSTWASGAKTLPTLRDGVQTDAMSAYIALGMGLTQEETMAMTQAAVQSGVGTYEGTGTATDSVTATGLKGWLDTIRLSIVAGFSDVITSITDFFTPDPNVEFYALDLKGLFPFCIPFDLYNLLLTLQAEPVTPYFEFELNFGALGSFPVVADFSEWNDLASLLRNLEVALFIVGLGIKTRELIGG